MLKLGRVTKVKVFFLVLVFVFNFDLCKCSAAILEKGLFLTPQQISAYFSRRAAKIRQQPPNDADIRESEEEDNFARARELLWPFHSSIPSRLINMIFATWPRMDHWSD